VRDCDTAHPFLDSQTNISIKIQSNELDRRANHQVAEFFHVGGLDPDREEGDLFARFLGFKPLRGLLDNMVGLALGLAIR